MRAHIISDLHFDYKENWMDFWTNLDTVSAVPYLIIAGDLCPLGTPKNRARAYDALLNFCTRYENVVYIPGNHEFYQTSISEGIRLLNQWGKEIPNLHVLGLLFAGCGVSYKRIDGQGFTGGTMWFPENDVAPWNQFPDFALIKNFKEEVYRANKQFINSCKNLMVDEVIVTHHLPSPGCIAEEFKNNEFNPFFLCDMEAVIKERQPKLWIHGHSHYPSDVKIGNTRIYANPYGYPNERSGPRPPNPNFWDRIEITA